MCWEEMEKDKNCSSPVSKNRTKSSKSKLQRQNFFASLNLVQDKISKGTFTCLFALHLQSDHLRKSSRTVQVEYCGLSCRLYDTLGKPGTSQWAAPGLGQWCTGRERWGWSSLVEFCNEEKKVHFFYHLWSFNIKYIYIDSLVQALTTMYKCKKWDLKL